MRFYFRKELRATIECEVQPEALRPEGKLVLGGLALMVAVLLTASALKLDLGLPACVSPRF